jgi:GntR family transcriptional regulator
VSAPAGGATPSLIFRADYPEPLWLQAAQSLRAHIDGGSLPAGSRLPPERELCQLLGISRVTLRKALTRLVEEGVLRSSHGRGWYIAAAEQKEWPNSLESFSETADRMGLVASSAVLGSAVVKATIDQAEPFQIAPGTALFRLERVRMLNDVPIALDLALVPLDLVPGLVDLDFRTESLYGALASAGFELAHAETTIEAREASATIAQHLSVQVGSPTLVMLQLVRNKADRPVLASTIQYAGDRYRLRTSFARAYPAGGRE